MKAKPYPIESKMNALLRFAKPKRILVGCSVRLLHLAMVFVDRVSHFGKRPESHSRINLGHQKIEINKI